MTTPTNANEEWEKELDEILKQVESDFQMGGLSSGLYADYAIEVAKRAVESYKSELIKELENPSYVGVLDSNEKRRGYEIANTEFISLINNK